MNCGIQQTHFQIRERQTDRHNDEARDFIAWTGIRAM